VAANHNEPPLDARLHLERIPAETLYFAAHALEGGAACIGFVFRDANTQQVIIVFDREEKQLTAGEAKRLMQPHA
jgi:hypothetical protein